MHVDLRGRSAVVTGAASGIGRAIAETFAEAGARVLLADLNASDGEKIASSLTDCAFQKADIGDRGDCKKLIDRAVDLYGGVDILVNNAGLQRIHPVEEFPEDEWERLIRVMLVGAFLLTKYAVPHMYRKGWGRIVNISSLHGLVASPYKSAYISAKHGLLGLTKTVALEAGAKGVTVNAICPSYVRTGIVEAQIRDQAKIHGISEEDVVQKIMLEPAAIKRLLEPREVAAYALFLCSDEASGITGSAQVMDAGWTAR